MMVEFSPYWKEVAVIIAAFSVVLGTFFDVRNRRTKRLTHWGKIFFAITGLSMIGGFYAQWQDNENDSIRNKKSQEEIAKTQSHLLELLSNTNKILGGVSRSLQPIDTIVADITLKVRCDTDAMRTFCKDNKKIMLNSPDKRFIWLDGAKIDWSHWLSGLLTNDDGSPHFPVLQCILFKDIDKARDFIQYDSANAWSRTVKYGDLNFKMDLFSKDVLVKSFLMFGDDLEIHINETVQPEISTGKILSFLDLPSSILMVYFMENELLSEGQHFFDLVQPYEMTISSHGHSISTGPNFSTETTSSLMAEIATYQIPDGKN